MGKYFLRSRNRDIYEKNNVGSSIRYDVLKRNKKERKEIMENQSKKESARKTS